ncbi:sulfide dehydrogenase [flavocytochrome c] flavoprotein chain precursor [Variibacter gotjawalensis]|uniref:Sulfide dehydrogenase [flavocytochrome c] flavoprotein chain n=1 Tax=Variibacter gotjawalensis TaxID=1333996 RepID=A0A0S3PYM2_9BRAD|nr:NAD(P)/FAD-dependent oxidoreductase [Variibacter gotjawalensis]NIK46827.1 NADPH-dependent 2,4-dienoyl-CoA reductase/sulfur reductase-like enzyme [Variibacter gotjawalensis]RZS48731.1 NADPH-dependent 2,4-dienoyl-CoA reductase/sulfur reductase-like enzyme [Variibacter gotjawalensis]BAT60990.1 sulfide dehydrogenase [flavocytochrome c] flavoprotein chain precursor [Variibacter gotjawalensis]
MITSTNTTRRHVLKLALGAGAASMFAAPVFAQGAAPRVVVIGGGFAGTSAARELKRQGIAVTLIELNQTFTACPFSNVVIGGSRELKSQQFGYDAVKREGITLVQQMATGVDAEAKRVMLADGTVIPYDRLVVTPGIDIRYDALPGYTESATQAMPHAWRAGEQTDLLRRQLESLEDGGLVVMSVPANPFRCPPGPYERASLIAHYLKTKKPKSKLIVLDAKDQFSKQRLFQNAWKELYPDHLEWVSLSQGGKVNEVDPATKTLTTDFKSFKAAVANVIPPQRAGKIAQDAGVANNSGWCPIDPVTFESKLKPNIHVFGDACIAGAMPKSAFSANAQAKSAAQAIATLLKGGTPAEPKMINTCYSLVAPDYGISVAGVYRVKDGVWADVEGAGGVSPIDAPADVRKLEAQFADGWFQRITTEVYG